MDVYNNNEEIFFEAKSAVRPESFFGIILFPVSFPFRYLRKWSSQYTLTNERLTLSSGIIGKRIDEVELYRIKDTTVTQGFIQRMMGTGNITVYSDDMTADFTIRNVFGAKEKRETIRANVNKSRKEHNVRIVTN